MKNGILFGILLHLLKNGRTSARALALKFEISEKTVYRYIEELDLAGVPTVANRGRGGGIEIFGRYSLSDSFLSKREIAALSAFAGALPLGECDKIVMKDKLFSNAEYSREFIDFESAIVFDTSPWLTAESTNEDKEILLSAIEQRRVISFDYNKGGRIQRRTASPHSLVFKEGQLYIFSHCHTRDAIRLFRVSRTKNIKIEEDRTFHEKRFSREEILSCIQNSFGEINLSLRVKKGTEGNLEEFVNVSNRTLCEDFEIICAKAKNTSDLIYRLLEFEDNLRVISPLWLRDKILQICKNISKNYSQ